MKYYIAYGSNLSTDQMHYRCPDAKIAGQAVLKDWKLVFRTHATIEPCPGSEVPVLVWAISDADEKRLDRYEGFPKYYIKQNLDIAMAGLNGKGAKKIKAMVYIMTEGKPIETPYPDYLYTIIGGYRKFGFDEEIVWIAFDEARKAERS